MDTNTRISVSTRDIFIRKLASRINQELIALRRERLKFRYSEGDLKITLERNGTVTFENRAIHLSQVETGKLFDRFYRVDSVRAKQVGGTGLGLSIVQQIVHDHEGMIDVVSTARNGTTFTVYLPVDL